MKISDGGGLSIIRRQLRQSQARGGGPRGRRSGLHSSSKNDKDLRMHDHHQAISSQLSLPCCVHFTVHALMLLSIPVQLLSFVSCAASSSVPYRPGQSDGNSTFFRTNSTDPRTYPAGKIAVLE